jgi:hypothetical protein
MNPGLPKYQLKVLAADGAVSGSPCRVMAILVDAEHADWEIELTNDADGSGTNVLELGGEAEGGQTYFDFCHIGGIFFSSKCYADVTTTGGAFQFWLDNAA